MQRNILTSRKIKISISDWGSKYDYQYIYLKLQETLNHFRIKREFAIISWKNAWIEWMSIINRKVLFTILAPNPNLPLVCLTPCLLPDNTLPNISPMFSAGIPNRNSAYVAGIVHVCVCVCLRGWGGRVLMWYCSMMVSVDVIAGEQYCAQYDAWTQCPCIIYIYMCNIMESTYTTAICVQYVVCVSIIGQNNLPQPLSLHVTK